MTEDNVAALQQLFKDQRLRFYRSELLNGNGALQDRLLQERSEVSRLSQQIDALERRLDHVAERAAMPALTWSPDESA